MASIARRANANLSNGFREFLKTSGELLLSIAKGRLGEAIKTSLGVSLIISIPPRIRYFESILAGDKKAVTTESL